MTFRSVLTMFLIVIAVVPLAAQGSVGIGPQIGFYKAKDADRAMGMGGLSMRLKLSDGFGMEGSINFRKERYYNGALNINSWPVMVTGLFYLAPVVYGAIGAGWYNSSIEYTFPSGTTVISETHQEVGWHFGGGVELPLGINAKLIADIRYVFLDYDFTNFPGSGGVNSNFYVMTIGILFGI